MIKVGITGGIGSGKTTFCKELESLGAHVVYADDLAKEVMHTDEELKAKIKRTFGDEAYLPDGSLNREFLAAEAFEKNRVDELNALVHPVLWKRVDEIAEIKKKEGVRVLAKEAAILLNNGRPEDIDYVILLLADRDKRIERTMERDQSSRSKIESRIQKQPDFQSLTHLADFVVINDQNISSLKEKAAMIYNELIELEATKVD